MIPVLALSGYRVPAPASGGGGGGGPGLPDLTQLPAATGQARDNTAYDALNVDTMAAGGSYADPETGITIWKVTSATVPLANTSMIPDYFEAGPRISHPWGDGWQYTIGVMRQSTDALYLVDFDLQTGTFSNWRALADTTYCQTNWGFSLDSSEPQILYKMQGDVFRRWNTATDTEDTAGVWPKDFSADSGGLRMEWLGHGTDARWFVCQNQGLTKVVAWNADTDTTIVRTEASDFPSLDEVKTERNGAFAWVRHNTGNTWWNLDANTVGTFSSDASNDYKGHAGTPRGYAVGCGADSNTQAWYFAPAGAYTEPNPTVNIIGAELNCAGQWVTLAGDGTQYVVMGANEAVYPSPKLVQCAIGYCRIDNGDYRLICHTYAAGQDHSVDPYYLGYIWGQPSPDGRLVMFKSSMNSLSGRADTFLAEIPRA